MIGQDCAFVGLTSGADQSARHVRHNYVIGRNMNRLMHILNSTLPAQAGWGVQLKEQPGLISYVHPTWLPSIHNTVRYMYQNKVILDICLAQESKTGVGHACIIDLDAGVWILVPRCMCLNWIAHGNFHSILAWGLFISGYYFKGCDWPPFCEWRGEQIWQLLIPRVKESYSPGWLLTLGAQDENPPIDNFWTSF
jgi:hypothetical protein